MAIFDEWPYTNFHELNLSWVIKEIKANAEDIQNIQEIAQYYNPPTSVTYQNIELYGIAKSQELTTMTCNLWLPLLIPDGATVTVSGTPDWARGAGATTPDTDIDPTTLTVERTNNNWLLLNFSATNAFTLYEPYITHFSTLTITIS